MTRKKATKKTMMIEAETTWVIGRQRQLWSCARNREEFKSNLNFETNMAVKAGDVR